MADKTDGTSAKEETQPGNRKGTPDPAGATGNSVDFMHKGSIIEVMAAAGSGRNQPMEGFSPDYTDIVDYIIRSTHKMWEEGALGLLYQHYAENTVVWSDWGVNYGRERTMEYVIQRQSSFPDLRGYADDVIWAGDDTQGFRTSHRGTQIGHNYGPSKYGPATGRRVQFQSIANCVVRNNRVSEEWLVHDELTVVRQLGLDVHEVLRDLTEQLSAGAPADIIAEVPRVQGQTTPTLYQPKRPGLFDVEDFVRLAFDEIWNWRLLNKIPGYYAANTPFHAPSDRQLYGQGAIRAFVLAILAAFPDGMIEIDDLYWNGNEKEGYRVAIRWTFMGTHRGLGIYGKATGRPIRLIGSTQQRIKDGKIVEEWTFFNELALLWKLRYA
ncbi:MAG: ester cyclase [Chloroflexota bacterium]